MNSNTKHIKNRATLPLSHQFQHRLSTATTKPYPLPLAIPLFSFIQFVIRTKTLAVFDSLAAETALRRAGDEVKCHVSAPMFRSGNVAARIFEREIRTPAPGTSVHCARQFYENIVPSCTVYDVECPDLSFRKFSDDGQYLITFGRHLQDLIVYKPSWLSYSFKEEEDDLPARAKSFGSFFTQLYSVPLASTDEVICKDFFLYMENNQFGLFATSTALVQETPATGGAIPGVPLLETITFHLLRLEDGVTLDEKVFKNDFVHLAHNAGVCLYDDLLAILSLRYQTIHILQVRESGNLVDIRAIGAYCREDDELFLRSSSLCMTNSDKSKMNQSSGTQDDDNVHSNQTNADLIFLTGIKQRLLSFIFRTVWNEEIDDNLRVQSLKKKFYFHFQDYVDLIIWKVQFLDRQHLLIKFGSVDGGVSRTADHHPSFFAVYNMETTDFVAFYQNSAEELYFFFEQFCDHFYATSRNAMNMKFISSHSNNFHALEQLRSIRDKASSFSQFVKKMLVSLPFSCQSLSPSPYFDLSLFKYDEKAISATDRHRPSSDSAIKFISRRPPGTVKFKIKQGILLSLKNDLDGAAVRLVSIDYYCNFAVLRKFVSDICCSSFSTSRG